jgi:hypothetical protein
MKYIICFLFMAVSCTNTSSTEGTFGFDLEFLKKSEPGILILEDLSGDSKIIISPNLQGRVMTSTAGGDQGISFGWLNYDLLATRKTAKHMTAFGGEERFWLGPEGGQFSIYFKKGVDFSFENWQVPAEIDSEPFELISATKTEAKLTREMHVENYLGTALDLRVDRGIRLLAKETMNQLLGIKIGKEVKMVGFETANSITNTGKTPWNKTNGMLSIWILSMLNASEKTMVVAPYRQEGEGPVYTDDYFGKVPADRLRHENGVIFFKADAKYRSKIGISPSRALPFIGSYDAQKQVLTVAQFDLPGANSQYVDGKWELQKDPLSGDAVNAYNDGVNQGTQLGKFYEIESSSPAADLEPGKTLIHHHRTMHFMGPKEDLDQISLKVFGIPVDQIK